MEDARRRSVYVIGIIWFGGCHMTVYVVWQRRERNQETCWKEEVLW